MDKDKVVVDGVEHEVVAGWVGDYAKDLIAENTKLKEELDFYRALNIRRDGVTAIGGDTADKLHDLYTTITKLKEEVEERRKDHSVMTVKIAELNREVERFTLKALEEAEKFASLSLLHIDLQSALDKANERISSKWYNDISLVEQLTTANKRIAEYERLVKAVTGLSVGIDWNKGTHAKLYRKEVLEALRAIQEVKE